MDEIKPCPFCGSPAFEYPDGDMEGYSIMCSGKHALFNGSEDRCPMNTFGYDSQEASIKAWNRRAALAATQAGWVSVNDRLPTSSVWVLAHNGKWTGVATYEVLAEWIDERWRDERSEFVEKLGPTVTHWMPLPAAPESSAASKDAP